MAVQALYYSERDGLEMALKHPDTMLFSSKAEADARDKVLEHASPPRYVCADQSPRGLISPINLNISAMVKVPGVAAGRDGFQSLPSCQRNDC